MDTPDLDRLSLLERAHLLHDATLRRHGEMLEAHEARLDTHEARMAELGATLTALRQLQAGHQGMLEHLITISAQLQQTLDGIKDLLRRGNSH